jgi:hypothetical protein
MIGLALDTYLPTDPARQPVPFTASHAAGGCRRGPLRRCRRQVMPAARIPAAGTSVDRANCCLRRKA